jgi:8-oxo-dGTP diphosphatase
VGYISHIPQSLPVVGLDDAAEAKWWPVNDLPPLAFDHAQILHDALLLL